MARPKVLRIKILSRIRILGRDHNTSTALLYTYLEPEDHDVEAAGDGVDHVEEEVSVVAVADAVVEPGAVVVHLEHAAVAHRAVVGARGLRVDALLAHGHHLKGQQDMERTTLRRWVQDMDVTDVGHSYQ